jgi:hypothetical protein
MDLYACRVDDILAFIKLQHPVTLKYVSFWVYPKAPAECYSTIHGYSHVKEDIEGLEAQACKDEISWAIQEIGLPCPK